MELEPPPAAAELDAELDVAAVDDALEDDELLPELPHAASPSASALTLAARIGSFGMGSGGHFARS